MANASTLLARRDERLRLRAPLQVGRVTPCAPFAWSTRRAEDSPPYRRANMLVLFFGKLPDDTMLAAVLPRAALLPHGSGRLRLRARSLKTENGFAFLHQIEPIASDRFEVAHVCLE